MRSKPRIAKRSSPTSEDAPGQPFSTPRRIWSSSIDSNKRAEIALAEALVALALDDFEEDRADDRLGEDLQQHLAFRGRAVEQDPVAAQPLGVLLVPRQARGERLVVRVRRVLEVDLRTTQRLDRRVDVGGAERDVLDAFAAVVDQVLLDLALVVARSR